MNFKISEITQTLFEKIPHTKLTVCAKQKISEALEKEYQSELIDKNEIQATGEVLSRYGSLESAGKLAGYSDEEISSWNETENALNDKQLSKAFRKTRHTIYFTTAFLVITIVAFLNMLIYRNLWGIVSVLIFGLPAFLFMRKYIKSVREYDSGKIRLMPDGYERLKINSDRFSKRLLNSMFLSVAGFFYMLFEILSWILELKLKTGEAISSMWTNVAVVDVVLFILVKNILCRIWLDSCEGWDTRRKFDSQLFFALCGSVAYWIIAVSLILFFRDSIIYYNNYMILALVVYSFGVLIYNLTIRKNLVFKNIVKNAKRIAVFGTAIVVFGVYQFMQMDSWLLQPYISSIPAVEYTADKIDYNEDNGVYTITTDKADFKILQLTDIHLGGSAAASIKDLKALNAVYDLINNTKPDLVIVTGDLVFPLGLFSMSFNNTAPIIQFSSFMRNIGIPWAFVYGNHDTENLANGSVEDIQKIFMSASYKTSQNLLYPYIQPDITGRNNQLIEIRRTDGSLEQALFLMDSNDYTGNGMNDYDYIHDDEVEWYKGEVERLNKEEGRTVSSMLFFHMPLQEYRTAYELYTQDSDEVKYFFGENGETMINKVCCSNYPSKLFDTAYELGSTKAMFCGHDHYNNLSVEYKGIRLTYGMSIDYLAMPGIDHDTKQRGATTITIHNDESFDIEQVKLTDIPRSNEILNFSL